MVKCQAQLDSESPDWSASACHVGRRQRQRSAGAQRRVAGTGVGPVVQDQDDGVVEGAAPGVEFACGVALGAAVVLAVAAEAAEGGGVGAGFGEEVAAVAECMGPFAQPGPCGDEAAVTEFPGGAAYPGGDVVAAAEFPRGGDHLLVVPVAAQVRQVTRGAQGTV